MPLSVYLLRVDEYITKAGNPDESCRLYVQYEIDGKQKKCQSASIVRKLTLYDLETLLSVWKTWILYESIIAEVCGSVNDAKNRKGGIAA